MDLTSRMRFQIAPGGDPALPATWIFQDRSADVNHKAPVTISGGRADEISEVDAGLGTLEVDNAGGHYCTANPLGRWYGLLARNCPARFGVVTGAEAFNANTTNGWGTPDIGTSWSYTFSVAQTEFSSSGGYGQKVMPNANSANSGILNGGNARNGEATVTIMAPAVATGASLIYIIQARYRDSSDHLLFQADLGVSGTVTARIGSQFGGTLTGLGNAAAGFTYSAGQRLRMRAQWDGQDLRLRVWPEASAEPTTWTVTATDTQCMASGIALRSWRVAGNTNTSPAFCYDDFEVVDYEITGTIPAFPVRWDPTAAVSWSPIQIAGITRRLTQGQQPLSSPIYRQLKAQPVSSYWPLEDGATSTFAASAVPRGQIGQVYGGVTFGSSDCPPGASSAAVLQTAGTSKIVGKVGTWPVPQDGYAIMCYFRIPTPPGALTTLLDITAAGTIARWVVLASTTGFTLQGYLADGTLSVNSASGHGIDLSKWTAIQLETTESGATVTWALIWYQVGSVTFVAATNTYTGTADRVYSATVIAPADGTLASHLWFGDDLLAFVDPVFVAVSSGYAGELASDRIARLCRESGIPVAIEAGTSTPMGIQTFVGQFDLIREAEAADGGILYESGASLGYRPGRARYNRPTSLTLAISPTGDLGDEPEPTNDDQKISNDWTVFRTGGSSATDSDPVHIAANGRYPAQATLNVQYDALLSNIASWRVHLGTWGEYRWPQIVMDLTDRPALLAAWLGRLHGPRITVTGVPGQGPIGATVDLFVEGWTQEITSHSWRVTLNCSPARMWDVGVYGSSRYDSATTTTAGTLPTGTVGQSGVSLALSTVDVRDTWSTTSVPYDAVFSGERVTVTAMTAAAGTGPFTQTATITRGVGGLVKTHVVGEQFSLATPARYAL